MLIGPCPRLHHRESLKGAVANSGRGIGKLGNSPLSFAQRSFTG